MVVNPNRIISEYLDSEIPDAKQLEDKSYSMFWSFSFQYKSIKIDFEGDAGGFTTTIVIEGTKYPLWQYDHDAAKRNSTTEENILYQLHVIKDLIMKQ